MCTPCRGGWGRTPTPSPRAIFLPQPCCLPAPSPWHVHHQITSSAEDSPVAPAPRTQPQAHRVLRPGPTSSAPSPSCQSPSALVLKPARSPATGPLHGSSLHGDPSEPSPPLAQPPGKPPGEPHLWTPPPLCPSQGLCPHIPTSPGAGDCALSLVLGAPPVPVCTGGHPHV